ncbi:MAG: ADP-ribosylglycohydrolase family protein [Thermodesulfobacteriota bacterium]
MDVRDRARAAVLASLAGDCLALGPHWIYDPGAIAARFGRVQGPTAPGPDSYHKNRGLGQFTHYGDQTMALLRSVAAARGFDLANFFGRWRRLFAHYDGYLDQATRKTLARIDFGEGPETSGSDSQDLAGAARIAPLAFVLREDLPGLTAAARAQTRMTHNSPRVVDAAEFFARAAHAALHGADPVAAMQEAAGARYLSLPARDWLEQGLEFAARESVPAIAHFGQGCNVEGAFRAVVQLVARHRDDLRVALADCVMAGGDSAARALLAGLVLGAAQGPEALPAEWLAAMRAAPEVEQILAALP